MKRKAIHRRLLLAGLSLVLIDAAISIFAIRDGLFASRPLPPFGAITHPAQREWLAIQRADMAVDPAFRSAGMFDPELGWCYRGSYQSPDGLYAFNSIGARGKREYSLRRSSKTKGATRLICFGDSFTYGDEVVDDDCWAAQLERLDSGVEAINLGVSGFGTDQALLRFRREGPSLEAQVVCIGLMLENIGRNANRYRPLWYPSSRSTGAKPRFVLAGERLVLVPLPIAERSELLDAVESGAIIDLLAEHEHWRGPRLGWLRFSSLARLGGALWAARARNVKRLWLSPGGEPFRVTTALLRKFHEEALESGASEAPVLIFPRETDVQDALRTKRVYWQTLLDFLGREGIPCIDFASLLVEQCRGSGEPTSSWYIGGHLNRKGNALVAATLHDWLDRMEQLPRDP